MDRKKAVGIIERHLNNYKTYHIGVKNLERELDDILPSITTNYTLREGTNGVFEIKSKVEDAVLNRIVGSRAIYLREQMLEYERIIESIDNAIGALGEQEREYCKYRYIEGQSVPKVASRLNVSVDACTFIRNRTMNRFMISLSTMLK